MTFPVLCLLSSGDLKFLPFDTNLKLPWGKDKKKDSESNILSEQLVVPTPTNSSLYSDSSSGILASPTPEIINLNNDTIINSSHSAHSVYLPSLYVTLSSKHAESDSHLKKQLFKILTSVFPTWSYEDIQIKQLTGGITNMLLSVTNTQTTEVVLFRTYGQGTGMIIDRDREFVSQLFLNSLGLAAPIHARFGNGLVYGFLSGRSLAPEELADARLYPFIAQRLGHWHKVIKSDDIYEGVIKLRDLRGRSSDHQNKLAKDVWELLEDWIQVLPEIDSLLQKCLDYKHILELKNSTSLREILIEELKWLIEHISFKSPTVSCHSDLLSGNVIIPEEVSGQLQKDTFNAKLGSIAENPISFIDYEYMSPAPRAFDISNHLMEWQGFECDKSKIPVPSKNNPVMRNWSKAYLSVEDHEVTEAEIDDLIDEISVFYGLPGFYWGIWAAIQSTISIIDFDYKNYCCERLEEYFVWKQKHVSH